MPILFLIFISDVFNKVLEESSLFKFLSFIDDLRFIALDTSVKKLVKTLENVAKAIPK